MTTELPLETALRLIRDWETAHAPRYTVKAWNDACMSDSSEGDDIKTEFADVLDDFQALTGIDDAEKANAIIDDAVADFLSNLPGSRCTMGHTASGDHTGNCIPTHPSDGSFCDYDDHGICADCGQSKAVQP